jgi:hypothetical protein
MMVHTRAKPAHDEGARDDPPAGSPSTAAATTGERAAESSDTEGSPGEGDARARRVRPRTDDSDNSGGNGGGGDDDHNGDNNGVGQTAMDAADQTLTELESEEEDGDDDEFSPVERDPASGMMALDLNNPNVTISNVGKAVLRVPVDAFPMPAESLTCHELRQMSEESSKGLVGVACPSCPSSAFRNTQVGAWKKSASKQQHDVDFGKKVRCEASPNLFHETSDCTPTNRRVAAVRKGACLTPAGSSAVSPSRARAQVPVLKCLMSRHYKRWQTFFDGRVPFFCACCPGCIDSLTCQIYEITGMDIREETEGDTEEELEDSLSEVLATILRCKHLCSRRETPDTIISLCCLVRCASLCGECGSFLVPAFPGRPAQPCACDRTSQIECACRVCVAFQDQTYKPVRRGRCPVRA